MDMVANKVNEARTGRVIDVQRLDPEWTHWAKCPVGDCKVVTHACCSWDAEDGMLDHVMSAHSAVAS